MLSLPADFALTALDAAPDAMIIIDDSGAIRFANRQVAALFGYRHQDDIVGRSVELLMPARFHSQHVRHRETYATSARARPMGVGLKLLGVRKDGSEFPVEISLSSMQDQERILVTATIRDVSERERVEAELTAARQTADRARVAADQARDTADKASQAKGRFLATASHDLRQPLQTLSLLNGALRRIVAESDATEVIAQQEQAIGAMSRLVNALLDISKLESGAVNPEPTDFRIADLFLELGSEFANLASEKGLQFLMEEPIESVHADRALVEQILRNLISNAIKYTRLGHVALRSHACDASVVIEVSDTGIGIPAKHLQHIFDEFYQVGGEANSTRQGYGLGLSIVQRIIKLLDLKIDVRSEVGKGSIFSLALPVATDLVSSVRFETETQSAPDKRGCQPRVLLIEGDPGVRDATRMLLKVGGYRVVPAASIGEAMEHVGKDPTFDFLVVDHCLTGSKNGTDVVEALWEVGGSYLKGILITGAAPSVTNPDSRTDPRVRFVSEPIWGDELLSSLKSLPKVGISEQERAA